MKKRLDVHGSVEEFAAWKAAAGDVALGRWARRVLNEAALFEGTNDPVRVVVAPDGGVPTNPPLLSAPSVREFKPDFGSRLKKEGKK